MSKPIRPLPPPALSQKTAKRSPVPQTRTKPAAPPVYHPQPAPKVLQRKTADEQRKPAAHSNRAPAAPPVYRPQPTPKVLQRKAAAVPAPASSAPRHAPAAPPVYRPQPVPKVLQTKAAKGRPAPPVQARQKPAPPRVYRPQAPLGALQAKSAGRAGGASGAAAPRGPAPRHDSGAHVRKHACSSRHGAVVQRTQEQAQALIEYGRYWRSKVWVGNDKDARDNLIAEMNKTLGQVGIKVGTGWQDYDPVVRQHGKAHTYGAIVQWACKNNPRQVAEQFINWYAGKGQFADLPEMLQDFAVITHWAETARGYEISIDTELYPLMKKIAAAQNDDEARGLWESMLFDYTPAPKSSNDPEYKPGVM